MTTDRTGMPTRMHKMTRLTAWRTSTIMAMMPLHEKAMIILFNALRSKYL